jgi:serine/threonine protein kinase
VSTEFLNPVIGPVFEPRSKADKKFLKQVLWTMPDGTTHFVRFREEKSRFFPGHGLCYPVPLQPHKFIVLHEGDLRNLGYTTSKKETVEALAKIVQRLLLAQKADQISISPDVAKRLGEVAQYAFSHLPKSITPQQLKTIDTSIRRVPVRDERGNHFEIRLKKRGDTLFAEVRGVILGKGASSKVEDVWAVSVFSGEEPVRFAYAKSGVLSDQAHSDNRTPDEIVGAHEEHTRIIEIMKLVKNEGIPQAAEGVEISSTNDKTILSKVYPKGTCKSLCTPPIGKERYDGEELRDRLSCLYDCFLFCAALQHLGYVHCDLKPENLFIEDSRASNDPNLLAQVDPYALPSQAGALRARVGDFGTVVKPGPGVKFVGYTLGYSPPDISAKTLVTQAHDAYSLGIMLRQFVYGKRNNYPSLDDSDPIDSLIKRLTAGTLDNPGSRLSVAQGKEELGAILRSLYQGSLHASSPGPSHVLEET